MNIRFLYFLVLLCNSGILVSGGATLELFTRDIFGHPVKHILLNRETS